jgi:hypothetical protein
MQFRFAFDHIFQDNGSIANIFEFLGVECKFVQCMTFVYFNFVAKDG